MEISSRSKMFRSLFQRKKSNQKDLANTEMPNPSQQSVPDAAGDATFSDKSKPEKTKKTKKTWKSRLFSCFQTKGSNSQADTSETTPKQPTKKWYRRLKFWKKKKQAKQASTASVSETDQSDPKNAEDGTSSSSTVTNCTEEVPCINDTRHDWNLAVHILFEEILSEHTWYTQETGKQMYGDRIVTRRKKEILEGGQMITKKAETTDPSGFPNIGNSCYMNACLQSLFSLEDFISSISCQEDLWSLVPEAQLFRRLMDIRDCRESVDYGLKHSCLWDFKSAFATFAPEYSDSLQKDAHEFLTLLTNQIQSMSPRLQKSAAFISQSYTCPVEDQFSFQMENMRTCKSCGLQSSHQEDFVNLSLDLIPEGSIMGMLEAYLKEKELEFRCECGGTTSGLESSFNNLPRVLVLHLKRFSVTPSFKLEKLYDSIRLDRNLVVSSKESGACYNLNSIISHCGNTEMGHYTCNSIHPSNTPESPTDPWLTFNDAQVSETTGSAVCKKQERLAYVLFYTKMETE